MRRINLKRLGTAPLTAINNGLLPALALLFIAGCHNTPGNTGSPLSGSSMLSPLSPVQGAATLSPIQPTSGVGSFGAPTRVPPPPTGSYNAPSNYGGTSGFGAPTANYAPIGSMPPGPTLGWSGSPSGVNTLSPSAPISGGSGVRQTGWVGDSPQQGNTGFGSGADPGPTPMGQAPPVIPMASPRLGGMQVIDLTQSPYPPGYVPPQNRPGAAMPPASYPQAAPQPPMYQSQAAQQPAVQQTNSTYVQSTPSTNGFSNATGYSGDPQIQTSSRPTDAVFPSTEPFPVTASGDNDDLQWRRPSPQF